MTARACAGLFAWACAALSPAGAMGLSVGPADQACAAATPAPPVQQPLPAEAAERVGKILQAELGLSDAAVAQQVRSYRAAIEHEKSVLMGDDS